MPCVLNKRKHGVPPGAVYVGRPSKWGNPFTHLDKTKARVKVSTREEAVELYECWLTGKPAKTVNLTMLVVEAGPPPHLDLQELRGKDLVCWCAPSACHAEVLLRLANRDPTH